MMEDTLSEDQVIAIFEDLKLFLVEKGFRPNFVFIDLNLLSVGSVDLMICEVGFFFTYGSTGISSRHQKNIVCVEDPQYREKFFEYLSDRWPFKSYF